MKDVNARNHKTELSVINKSEIIIMLVVVRTRNIANTIVDTSTRSSQITSVRK